MEQDNYFGLGFLKGTQTHLGYLYPKTTDFIYSVIGEEFGFITCSIIVLLYVMLITKCINIAKTAEDELGSYISIGLSGILFFQFNSNLFPVFINFPFKKRDNCPLT